MDDINFINKSLKDNSDDEFENTDNKDFSIEPLENEEMQFNPYNPNNKEINIDYIYSLFAKYGIFIKINNIELYKRAFVHRSYVKKPKLENEELNINLMENVDNCMPLKTKSNERLEFIGDGVLECVTKYYLYKRFPKADEGFMTEKKIALVKNEHIGKLAYEIGLHNYFIISKHAEEKKTRTNLKKLGCLFEAFIGAIFLDFNRIKVDDEYGWMNNLFVTGVGFQMAQRFIENIYERHVDWTKLIANDDNYKNKLQVIIQKEFKKTPDYVEISINTTSDGEKLYEMGVYISFGQNIHNANINQAINIQKIKNIKEIHTKLEDNPLLLIFLSKASHRIKKKAEQLACENAIKIIEQYNN